MVELRFPCRRSEYCRFPLGTFRVHGLYFLCRVQATVRHGCMDKSGASVNSHGVRLGIRPSQPSLDQRNETLVSRRAVKDDCEHRFASSRQGAGRIQDKSPKMILWDIYYFVWERISRGCERPGLGRAETRVGPISSGRGVVVKGICRSAERGGVNGKCDDVKLVIA
jgi:hypothetical protein